MKQIFTISTRLLTLCLLLCGFALSALAQPVITTVSPNTGAPGTSITIIGSGFGGTAAENAVFFGGVPASVIAASAGSLTVTVPYGAQYASVSVLNTTTMLTGNQKGLFLPNYNNSCLITGSNSFKSRFDITVPSSFTPNSFPRHATTGDVDGDGKPDMVVCTYNSNTSGQGTVAIYLNNSTISGVLSYNPTPYTCTTSNGGVNVKLADLDGDGKLDIVVACGGSGRVSCLRNTSIGTGLANLSFSAKTDLNPGEGPQETAIADFDGDGMLDIAVAAQDTATGYHVKVFRNRMVAIPSGSFPVGFFGGGVGGAYDSFQVSSGGRYFVPASIFAADFDRDGKFDLVTSNTTDGTISILRNTSLSVGTISFAPHSDIAAGVYPTEVIAADIDGDNKPDILTGSYGSSYGVNVFQNNSTVPGAIIIAPTVGLGGPQTVYAIAAGDFDGDGKIDVALTRDAIGQVAVLKNTHTGLTINTSSLTFTANYATGDAGAFNHQGITVSDMDLDGKADIVVAAPNTNKISIYENIGRPDTTSIIGSSDTVCVNSTLFIHDRHCGLSTAYWSVVGGHSSLTAGATDTSVTLTGLSAGVDTVIYKVAYLSDTNYVRFVVRVLPLADTGIIGGPSAVCFGSSITLTETVTGGVWSSSNAAVATVSVTGVVTGLAIGNATIFYTNSSLSCGPMSASHPVTVNPRPNAGTISGINGTCVGTSLTLTSSSGAGVWANVNPTIGTITSSTPTTATVFATTFGADTILYIVTNAFSCKDTAMKDLGFISSGTSASAPITGTTNICAGTSETLSNAFAGGTWGSTNPTAATVNSSGQVFALGTTADTATITYHVAYGVCNADTSVLVHILPLPVSGTISGPNFVYQGYTITLTTTGTGGTWANDAPAIATLTPTGSTATVTGNTLGTAIISYTVTNSCGLARDTQSIAVLPVPSAPVITNVTPLVGEPLVATVNITGTGFDALPANNAVYFGATQGNVIAATTTSLTVTLPIGSLYTSISYLNMVSLLACNQHGFFLPSYSNTCYVPGSSTFRPRMDMAVTNAHLTTPAASGPRGSAFGDVDGDGKADLIVSTYTTDTSSHGLGTVDVFLNNSTAGTISYAAPVLFDVVNGGVSLKMADLDGDGKLDIIVACSGSGRISCLRNTTTAPGSVSFGAHRELYPLEGCAEVAVADFDGDGKMDIAAAGGTSSQVKVFRNQMSTIPTGGFPAGFFGPDQSFDSFAVGATGFGGAASLAVADFDGDGKIDIVASVTVDNVVSVLRNTTLTTGLINFAPKVDLTTGTFPTEVQTAEITGNTKPEIVVLNYSSSNVSVFENNSVSGSLSFARTNYPTTDSSYGMGTGDLDGDGNVDIVITRNGPDSIYVLKNNHSGSLDAATFTLGASYSAGAGREPQGIAVGDIDGDKKPDVVISNFLGNNVSIFRNVSIPSTNGIQGTDSVCINATVLVHSPHCFGATGYWSVTNNNASIVVGASDTMANVTGVSAGLDTVVYTVVYLADTSREIFAISVKPLADTGAITGLSAVCVNGTLTLSNTATGGVWSSSAPTVATVDAATGVVTGLTAGSATISYTAQSFSCGPLSATHVVTVNALPDAGSITASSSGTCVGNTISLTASVAGGTWSTSNAAVATISSTTGTTINVGGASAGVANIYYVATTATCGNDTATQVVTVLGASPAHTPITGTGVTAGTATLCTGDSLALANATTGGTWSTSNNTVATVDAVSGEVHAIAAGTDTVRYQATYPCTTLDTFIVVTVNPAVNAGTISGADSVCVASSITLTTTGTPGTGGWHSRFGFVNVDPFTGVVDGISAGTDTVVFVSTTTCGTDSTLHVVRVDALPTIGVASGSPAVCAGSSTTLSATGGLSYSWTPSATLSASTGSPVTATPTAATTYTVTGTNIHGCSAINTVTVNVNALPTVAAAAGTSPICAGSTTTLSGTGANTYSWSPAANLSATTGAVVTFSGTSTSSYTVTGTDLNGCINTGNVTVVVTPLPTVDATVGASPICAGSTTTLNATGGTTYSWSPSTGLSASTGATVTFSGLATTSYTVTGTTSGCSDTAQVTITVNALPTIGAASGSPAVCAGLSTTLSATGGVSYTWTPSATLSASTGSPVTATPTANTTYSVTGTDVNGCSAQATVTVNVNALPTVAAAAGTSPICAGSTTTLSGTGANTYSWSPAANLSATTGAVVTFSGTSTSSYTVTGTDLNGCINTGNVTVVVTPLPTVDATVGASPICAGSTTTLSATGGTTYSWSPSTGLSASTGATVTFSGLTTTSYTVTGTTSGCSDTAQVTITVNALPTIGAASGSPAVCAGLSTTLSATGGVSYTWTPSATLSASTGSPVTATPTANTTYSVTGTDLNGCSAQATVTVNVNALPTVAAAAGTSPICAGSTTTLSGTGANTYSWSPAANLSATTGAVVTFSGTSTSSYTVTGTDLNGCINTGNVTVVVTPLPTVDATVGASPICAGNTTTLSATGGTTYSWSPSTGLSASTGATVTFSGLTTTSYTVTGTTSGCSDTAQVTITVNALPTIGAASGSPAVCAGLSTTLSATGGVSYTWTPSATLSASTGSPVTATPTANTTYSVTGTDLNGCSAQATVTVNVNALPTVAAAAGTSPICAGSTTTLSATGANTYSWSPAANLSATTGAVVTFSGTSTSSYTVTGTDLNGCINTGNVTVVVTALPTVDATVGASPLCAGNTTTLSATGGTTYSWSPSIDLSASTGATVTFSGTTTTTYTVTGTTSGCSDTAQVTITVNPLPLVTANAGSSIICAGVNTTLSAGGANTYSWSPATDLSATTGAVVTFSGTVTSSYTVTGTDLNGCTADASVTVSVNPQPNAGVVSSSSASSTVCVSATITVTSTGTTGGTWSVTNANASITGTGVVTGLAAGLDTVVYSVTNSCGTATDSLVITVNPLPDADTIRGANDSLCITGTMALTDIVTGGVWSSTNILIATVDGTGLVTPVGPGLDTIRYIYTNSCGSDTAIYPLTITPIPDAGIITGADSVCVASSITLVSTVPGGIWTSSDTSLALVDTFTGVVTGVREGGLVAIHYTFTNFCGVSDSVHNIWVNPLPFADTIHGVIDSVCIGVTLTLTDPAVGGVWTSSAPTIVSIDASGVAHSLSTGTAIISYAITNTCGTAYAVDTIFVKPTPVLTGPLAATVCSGSPFDYVEASTVPGTTYTWVRPAVISISNPANSDTGAIHETLNNTSAFAVGVPYTITLTAAGCSNVQTLNVTVNPTPHLISDTLLTVCSGSPLIYFATSSTSGTVFSWTRPIVPLITPTTVGTGTFVINETLVNGSPVAAPFTIPVYYYFTLSAGGCTNIDTVHVNVEPAPPAPPQITTKSPPYLCSGTMYQNFGAATVPPTGISYIWSSFGAQVWATGVDDQYCLVNFTAPGSTWVYLTSTLTGFTCTSRDSFNVIVSNSVSENPDVWYFNTDFVCSPSDEASYQWGYDDASTLDSTLLSGETNQNYYNPAPDFLGKFYWVITTHHGCYQKTYLGNRIPTGIKDLKGGVTDLRIFPNPNTGTFSVNIASDFTEAGTLTVTNLLGEKVMEAQCMTNRKIDMQIDKPAGIYFITVNTPHGKMTGKVTIVGN